MKISPQEALQRILGQSTKRKAKGTQIEFIRKFGRNGNVYLFQKGREWIAAPAENSLQPVIADCTEADFTTELPTVCEDWLHSYDDEISFIQGGEYLIEDEFEMWAGRKDVPALVKATWSQDAPYNDKLLFPENPKKCMVGCVAVTIGQIMQYWGTKGYHRGCTATTKYRWSKSDITVMPLPPIACFDYKNMTAGMPETKEQIEAVSTLLEYVGKAVQLNYSPSGTGGKISIYTKMMRDRLRLGKQIRSINADSIGPGSFEDAIYKELAEGRPVAMRGTGEAGAHSFICDGYRADADLFHFNWGWGGNYNGWYAMSALTLRAKHSFNSKKAAVIGIKPDYILGDIDGDGKISVSDAVKINESILNGQYNEKADVNHDGKVSIADTMQVIDHIMGKENL